jgi:methylmalonyl-CoA epimerase
MFKGVDHVVIAVKDLDAAVKQYETIYDMKADHGKGPGMKTAHFRMPDSFLEIITNDGDEGPVAKRLTERGDGVYLIAMRTDDIDKTLAELREKGVRLIGDPGPGNPATGQIFIHPMSAGGIHTQIIPR